MPDDQRFTIAETRDHFVEIDTQRVADQFDFAAAVNVTQRWCGVHARSPSLWIRCIRGGSSAPLDSLIGSLSTLRMNRSIIGLTSAASVIGAICPASIHCRRAFGRSSVRIELATCARHGLELPEIKYVGATMRRYASLRSGSRPTAPNSAFALATSRLNFSCRSSGIRENAPSPIQ